MAALYLFINRMATLNTTQPAWKAHEKVVFRIAFVYFLLQIIPLDWKYYQRIFAINWSHLTYRDLFAFSYYHPQFIAAPANAPEAGFLNWLIILAVAIIAALVWGNKDANRKEYNNLYYWLRVLLRYRLALGVIGYGIIKLFPVQFPGPTLSDLNTPYGDYFTWKIYALTNGVATTYYQSFFGFVELLGGLLLLNRKTTTFGAALLTAYLSNVAAANFAYDINEQVYSFYLLVIALALLAYDAPRLYNLLVIRRKAQANRFAISFPEKFQKFKIAAPVLVLLFTLLYGVKTYADYKHNDYAHPITAALKNSYGYYNVREFSLNGQPLPYSLTDSNRWQNVVFEKWSTISIRSARKIKPVPFNGNEIADNDYGKIYELAGTSGRHYYNYTADTAKKILILINKNPNEGDDKWTLHYQWIDTATLALTGTNTKQDSVHLILDRVNKQYLQLKGRRKPLVL
jgi:hypothetical protein